MKRNELSTREKRILKKAVLEEMEMDTIKKTDGYIILKLKQKNVVKVEMDDIGFDRVQLMGGQTISNQVPRTRKVTIELVMTDEMYEEFDEKLNTVTLRV